MRCVVYCIKSSLCAWYHSLIMPPRSPVCFIFSSSLPVTYWVQNIGALGPFTCRVCASSHSSCITIHSFICRQVFYFISMHVALITACQLSSLMGRSGTPSISPAGCISQALKHVSVLLNLVLPPLRTYHQSFWLRMDMVCCGLIRCSLSSLMLSVSCCHYLDHSRSGVVPHRQPCMANDTQAQDRIADRRSLVSQRTILLHYSVSLSRNANYRTSIWNISLIRHELLYYCTYSSSAST